MKHLTVFTALFIATSPVSAAPTSLLCQETQVSSTRPKQPSPKERIIFLDLDKNVSKIDGKEHELIVRPTVLKMKRTHDGGLWGSRSQWSIYRETLEFKYFRQIYGFSGDDTWRGIGQCRIAPIPTGLKI